MATRRRRRHRAPQEVRLNYDNHGALKAFFATGYFFENINEGVNLRTNMQYLYPTYIQDKLAAVAGQYVNARTYGKVVETVRDTDFSNIPTYGPILNMMKGQLARKCSSRMTMTLH